MAEDYAATGKYTTMDMDQLKASMAKVEGLGVVATVNEDGTPNAAIFVPMMPDAQHVVLVLAKNRSRENIERTGVAELVYDVFDPAGASKADQHRGARMSLELVGRDEAEYAEVAARYDRMNDYTLLFRVANVSLIG